MPTTLFRLMRRFPRLYLLNVALALVVALLDLAPGPLWQAFFNAVSTAGLRPSAAPAHFGAGAALALLVAVALARTVMKTNAVLADVLCEFNVETFLRRNTLAALLRRPGAQALQEAPGETLNRLRDDAPQLAGLLSQTWMLPAYLIFAAVALTLMVRIDVAITVLSVLPMVAVVVVTRRSAGRSARVRAASRRAAGQVSGMLGELFEAVQAIKLAGAETAVIGRLQALGEERQRSALRDALLTRSLDAVFANLVSLGTGLVLLAAAGAMRHGSFTVGDLALFVYYLEWVGHLIEFTGGIAADYRQAGVSLARLLAPLPGASVDTLLGPRPVALVGRIPAFVPPSLSPAPVPLRVCEVSNLTYHFPGGDRGITDVSLRLPRGSWTVVTGRVGAGKTTLLRALLGLLPRDAGEVRWNGEPIADLAGWCIPPRVAYVPQMPRLFSETLAVNVLLGLPAEQPRLDEALRSAVLSDDLPSLEHGLDTLVGPRGVRLSGGQVQRAAAARALVRRPELLVVDDLSSALDGETEQALWARLAERSNLTLLVVSHRRAAFCRADQIVVLAEGRVQAAGTLADVLARSLEFRQIWTADPEQSAGEPG